MSAPRELDRLVADWLHDEATSVGSERVLAAALGRVDAAGQDHHVTQRLFGDDRGRSRRLRWALLAATLVVVLLGTVVAAGALRREPTLPTRPGANGWIAFSANGEAGDDLSVTDVGRGTGRGDIYIARAGVAAQRIIGTGDDGLHQACPAFSPDGARLAYTELDMASTTPSPAPRPEGSWPEDEAPTPSAAGEPAPLEYTVVVVDVARDGGPAAEVARIEAPGLASCARWSPDGRSLAFVVDGSTAQPGLHVSALDGRTAALGPAGASDGAFAWSPDASSLAVLDGERLWLAPADGTAPRVLSDDGFGSVEWSPDGRHVAAGRGDAVSVMAADGTRVAEIDLDLDLPEMGDIAFAWSPDGQWIAWADADGVVRTTADGSRRERRPTDLAQLLDGLQAEPLYPAVPSVVGWSPDGTQVLLAAGGLDSPGSVLAVPWDPGEPVVVLVKPTFALRGIKATWQGVHE